MLEMCRCLYTGSNLKQKNRSKFDGLKLRSHRANGRETDENSFHPFVSGRFRLMSVSNPVNPFLVR